MNFSSLYSHERFTDTPLVSLRSRRFQKKHTKRTKLRASAKNKEQGKEERQAKETPAFDPRQFTERPQCCAPLGRQLSHDSGPLKANSACKVIWFRTTAASVIVR